MRTVEVMGAPGVGKSAVCNDLWPPSVEWDRHPPPAAWQPFLRLAEELAARICADREPMHWARMFVKAARKMATLHRSASRDVYAGVGFAMRGIDLAWRLPRPDDVAHYFCAMPVSVGVAVLRADVATIQARNRERGRTKPSRELSRLTPMLVRPIEIAVDTLKARGVPVLELDALEPIHANRGRLIAFAHHLDATAGAA